MQPAIREYLTKLRQDAFLEIKPGYVDTGAAPDKDTTWMDPAQLRSRDHHQGRSRQQDPSEEAAVGGADPGNQDSEGEPVLIAELGQTSGHE